ncbi:MAG: adenosylcobinamide-GDP ribazoletransferase, partial [Paracoccaceae bacterium]
MGKFDKARIQAGDLRRGLSLLSRLPVESDGERGAQSAWSWPLVGLLTGLLAALVGWLALGLGLPVTVAAGLALTTQIFVT